MLWLAAHSHDTAAARLSDTCVKLKLAIYSLSYLESLVNKRAKMLYFSRSTQSLDSDWTDQ